MWTDLPNMTTRRAQYPGVVAIRRGAGHRIYVFGGHDGTKYTDSVEFLDVGESEWTLLEATMTVARSDTCAVLLDHTTIVICGGFAYNHRMNKCESLDLITNTFSPLPDMLKHRFEHAGVHYNGTIVVIGGSDFRDDTCEQFDPAAFKWTHFASTNKCRGYVAAAVIEGKIYVSGGPDDAVEVYDGSVWSVVTHMPQSLHRPSAVALGGKLVVIGTFCSDVDVFDPDAHLWSCLTKTGEYRNSCVAVSF